MILLHILHSHSRMNHPTRSNRSPRSNTHHSPTQSSHSLRNSTRRSHTHHNPTQNNRILHTHNQSSRTPHSSRNRLTTF